MDVVDRMGHSGIAVVSCIVSRVVNCEFFFPGREMGRLNVLCNRVSEMAMVVRTLKCMQGLGLHTHIW